MEDKEKEKKERKKMPGLNLVEVLNPKSKERGILCDKCFMKSAHSMVMPTEI